MRLSKQRSDPPEWSTRRVELILNIKIRAFQAGERLWLNAAKLWLYHIILALPLSSLTTLSLFQPSFHLSVPFKTCQLTFQHAAWTSWCLCGGLPLGLCVALSVDRHMGSCLCLPAHFWLKALIASVFNVYAFHFFYPCYEPSLTHWCIKQDFYWRHLKLQLR